MRASYAHGWNTTTSLRRILTIVPRVPRWLVPLLGAVTSALCIASMKNERRAATRNLRRILGRGGLPLQRAVWGLFYNFSRFMVSYCRFLEPAEELARDIAPDLPGEARLADALARGKGLIVLTAHFGNWEIGARALERAGVPVHVVMRVERTNAAERFLARVRRRAGLRVLNPGGPAAGVLALKAALARNEILAMQGDRGPGERVLLRELFGAPFSFPLGPFLLAYGCGATLVPAFVVQEGFWRFRSVIGAPVEFPRTDDRDADLASGADQYARALEGIVRRHPDQWFNFYDLWPEQA